MFTLGTDWWEIILRSTAVYIAVLVGMRLVGRRQRSTVDFVLILIVANAVQNARIGSDTSLLGGLIAATTLFAIDRLMSRYLTSHQRARHLFGGSPAVLINHGQVIESSLGKEGLSNDDLRDVLVEHGIEDIGQVKVALLEMDGSLLIVPADAQVSHTKRKLHCKPQASS
ncbi:MAG: YetF domain-containing protein [Thermomicrobiales bacterium]